MPYCCAARISLTSAAAVCAIASMPIAHASVAIFGYPILISSSWNLGAAPSCMSCPDLIANGACHVRGARRATEIRRVQRRARHRLDGAHETDGRIALAKMLEHHRGRPEARHRVGNAFARDVECGAVDRLEHRRELAL